MSELSWEDYAGQDAMETSRMMDRVWNVTMQEYLNSSINSSLSTSTWNVGDVFPTGGNAKNVMIEPSHQDTEPEAQEFQTMEEVIEWLESYDGERWSYDFHWRSANSNYGPSSGFASFKDDTGCLRCDNGDRCGVGIFRWSPEIQDWMVIDYLNCLASEAQIPVSWKYNSMEEFREAYYKFIEQVKEETDWFPRYAF